MSPPVVPSLHLGQYIIVNSDPNEVEFNNSALKSIGSIQYKEEIQLENNQGTVSITSCKDSNSETLKLASDNFEFDIKTYKLLIVPASIIPSESQDSGPQFRPAGLELNDHFQIRGLMDGIVDTDAATVGQVNTFNSNLQIEITLMKAKINALENTLQQVLNYFWQNGTYNISDLTVIPNNQ
jgi:hypothetical protein